MKVFIITEGGRNMGYGHIARCSSLAQAFEEKKIIPEFIVNLDKSINFFLRHKKKRSFNWLKEKEKTFDIIKRADIAIIDSYMADYRFYKRLSKIVKVPVYIDDNKRIDYPDGIVVDSAILAENIDYPKNENVLYLLGVKYTPLRREFWDIPNKNIRKSIKSVMVTFGGDDTRRMTPIILRFLIDEYPNLVKNVIIGNGFRDAKQIERLKDKKTNFIYNPDAEEMKRIMLESDVAISAGGQTLYELARVGVPTIAVAVNDNQLMNVGGWEKNGFLEYIGRYDDSKLIEKLRCAMVHLEDTAVRKTKHEIGKKFIDGKGNLRVAKAILHNYFKSILTIRKAQKGDALDIFNLSNEKIVRMNSFYPERIKKKNHIKWFKAHLNDKNSVFFVFSANGRFAGQSRFNIDLNKKEATANISLTKDIRGLNLSSFLLELAINELLKIHSDMDLVKAYIKKENLISIKAFQKAHFRFLEDTVLHGYKTKIYIRKIHDQNARD